MITVRHLLTIKTPVNFRLVRKRFLFAYVNYDDDDRFDSRDLDKVLAYAKKHVADETTENTDFAIKQYDRNGNELDDLYKSL